MFAVARPSFAQDMGEEPDVDLDTIEAEIDRGGSAPGGTQAPAKTQETPEPNLKEPERLSDLGKLQPFSEVSVIQRRFLPKTERFQFFMGFTAISNDPWFWGVGGAGRLGYHFTESLAIEANFAFLSSSEKDAVRDLRNNNLVKTDSIISAQNYLGADLVWSPIYGKMSLFNRRIVPFDMYFSIGGGQAGITNAKQSSATAFHVGGGQIFAMSKGIGFRWDLSWNFYNATPNPPPGSTGTPPGESQFNNLLLTIGASFFFPEAKYR
ncbi:MAG: outer membrane beta-barrel domain-containing protein [Bdellovibrionaceae bacterium]|nr:outer membrane beta-barrel domain-containing protein [Pseudobdellovibrionaceae bacterium]